MASETSHEDYVEALKHDIARHMDIISEQEAEIERLRGLLEMSAAELRRASQYLNDPTEVWNLVVASELRQAVKEIRAALNPEQSHE